MNIETAREYCLSKKAATEDTPFGEDFLVIRVIFMHQSQHSRPHHHEMRPGIRAGIARPLQCR